ncbi:hypothetical protein FRC07_010178 [Ceratobasidium sp. 392]|nr:hypothetical protein FRC07_010178 [Ceratobasidium sp. 392]
MPPELENDLRNDTGTPTLAVERESTQRPNIAYRTAKFPTETAAIASLIQHVEEYRKQLLPGEGIMVQCRSKEKAESIARKLKALRHHSDMDAVVRDANARAWLSGKAPVIVATSGLGAGVHHPRCRAVFHLGIPFSLMTYLQESGRAGRDNKPALSVILHYLPRDLAPRGPDAARLGGWGPMLDVAEGITCMRLTISEWADDFPNRVSCSAGIENLLLCGPCKAEQQAIDDVPPHLLIGFDWPSHVPAVPPTTVATIPSSVDKGKGRQILPPSDDMDLCDDYTMVSEMIQQSPRSPTHMGHGVSNTTHNKPPPLPFPAPPAPIGLGVHADSVAARSSRRSNVLADSGTSVVVDKSHLEHRIIQVMNFMDNHCAHCLMHYDEKIARNHAITGSKCPYTRWDLATFVNSDGSTWPEAKDLLKAPGSAGICFMCLWPLALHPGKRYGQNCQKDQVGPICWFLYVNPAWRKSLVDIMRPANPIDTVQQYLKWMCTTVHKVQKPVRTDQYVILNAHVAVIWAMKFLKKYDAYDG